MKDKKILFSILILIFTSKFFFGLTAFGEENIEISHLAINNKKKEQMGEINNKDGSELLEIYFVQPDEMIVPLGIHPEDVRVEDFIDGVMYQGDFLKDDEFIVEFNGDLDDINTWLVGYHEVELKVTLKEDSEIYAIGDTYYKVMWKNTLVSRDGGWTIDTLYTSLSLLEDEKGNPYLRANYGNNENKIDERVRYTTFIDIYQDSNKESLISLSTEYNSTLRKNTEIWNKELENFDVQYGNVLNQKVLDHREKPSYGEATYASRLINNREYLVRETNGLDAGLEHREGYQDAYYELTPSGYRLLQLNQIEVKQNALKLETGDTQGQIDEFIDSVIDIPTHITNSERFTYELTDIDTSESTNGSKKSGKIRIYEPLETGGTFSISKTVQYEVKDGLKLKLTPKELPVGTDIETTDLNDYIEEVSFDNKKLLPSEYSVSLDNEINTKKVGTHETKLRVYSERYGKTGLGTTTTNIIWGNSIVTKVDDSEDAFIDTSVSLLEKSGQPYLVANEGTGFGTGNLYNRPFIAVFRNSTEEAVFKEVGYHSTNSPAKETMNKWNNGDDKTEALDSKEYQYGDVFRYRVNKNSASDTSEMGNKTWVSRDGKLVKETLGYDMAYYEMTKDGFTLLQLNQLEVKKQMPVVSMYTTIQEMNKLAKDAMIIPQHIQNPEKYRFEYASVDTESSGVKQTKMKIYEKLSTGKEFMTTYDVSYQVNPQVKESFYDTRGNRLKVSKVTDFDLGGNYQPITENYLTVGNDAYIYKGWLKDGEVPGKDIPREGHPEKVTKETMIHYIYEKADSYINMTIPTELIFGTEENSNKISSKNYSIKNNSEKVSTDVIISEFRKEKSDIKLLNVNQADPINQEKSARLNLTSNGTEVIKSLTEETKNEYVTTLSPGESTSIGVAGTYFGNLNDSNIVNYQMDFTFKVDPK